DGNARFAFLCCHGPNRPGLGGRSLGFRLTGRQHRHQCDYQQTINFKSSAVICIAPARTLGHYHASQAIRSRFTWHPHSATHHGPSGYSLKSHRGNPEAPAEAPLYRAANIAAPKAIVSTRIETPATGHCLSVLSARSTIVPTASAARRTGPTVAASAFADV